VRQIFAFAILIGCVRLWLGLNAAATGLSVSDAYAHDANRNLKGVEEPWLDAVEGILNGWGGLSRDSQSRPAMFRSDRP
jgi:hypothetical protein